MKHEKFFVTPVAGGYRTTPADPAHHPLLSKLHLDGPVDELIENADLADLVRRIREVGKREGLVVIVAGARASPTVLLREKPAAQRSPKPRKGWLNTLRDVAERLYDIEPEAAYDEADDAAVRKLVERISHRVYKYTNCGAWLAVIEGGEWNPQTGRPPARHPNGALVGLAVGSIVEGIDATTDTHELRFPFPEKRFWAALQAVDDEADELWKGTHGCAACAKHWHDEGWGEGEWGPFEGCDGVTPVWDECPECGGSGAII